MQNKAERCGNIYTIHGCLVRCFYSKSAPSVCLGWHVALWNDAAITLSPFARGPQIKRNEPSKEPWDSARNARCCRYGFYLESVVIDAILSSNSHRGEQKAKSTGGFSAAESCYLTNCKAIITTMKSISLALLFPKSSLHLFSLLRVEAVDTQGPLRKLYNVYW